MGDEDAVGEKLSFPEGFLWGCATASYQIEGSAATDGRTPSIWDTFSAIEGKVVNGDTGATACDHYVRFKEDVALIRSLGIPSYRLSISWSRLLPNGRGEVNAKAVAFYNALIDELVAASIEPLATLYHWDLPQCLEDEYGGWLSPKIADDFDEYAAVCFSLFGDRVKRWITLNEPWCSAALGYANGEHAPGRSAAPATEPYLAGHHLLLAHGRAYRRYHRAFESTQKGTIGITLNCDWREPATRSAADEAAAKRAINWSLDWFAEPIYGSGDYPKSMRERCGERLPPLSDADKDMLRGSADFFGLNHYSTKFASGTSLGDEPATLSMWGSEQSGGYFADQEVKEISHPNWLKTDMGWDVVPWGLHHLLLYIQRTYDPKGGILITENGCAVKEESEEDAVSDGFRVQFYSTYLSQVHRAIQDHADVRGYFAWSLMDNFEWGLGYTKRFGIVRVDYATQKRTPKASAHMFSEVSRSNALTVSPTLLEAARLGEPCEP
jgi:beta-galactosidase